MKLPKRLIITLVAVNSLIALSLVLIVAFLLFR
jgi:hypothetical protein